MTQLLEPHVQVVISPPLPKMREILLSAIGGETVGESYLKNLIQPMKQEYVDYKNIWPGTYIFPSVKEGKKFKERLQKAIKNREPIPDTPYNLPYTMHPILFAAPISVLKNLYFQHLTLK